MVSFSTDSPRQVTAVSLAVAGSTVTVTLPNNASSSSSSEPQVREARSKSISAASGVYSKVSFGGLHLPPPASRGRAGSNASDGSDSSTHSFYPPAPVPVAPRRQSMFPTLTLSGGIASRHRAESGSLMVPHSEKASLETTASSNSNSILTASTGTVSSRGSIPQLEGLGSTCLPQDILFAALQFGVVVLKHGRILSVFHRRAIMLLTYRNCY